MKRYLQFFFYLIVFFQLACKDNFEHKDNFERSLNIDGKWEVIETSFDFFDHPFSCYSLELNCIFYFDHGKFNIFRDKNSLSCLSIPQTYEVDSLKIRFYESDLIFDYNIVKFTKNELILNSIRIVPKSLYNRNVNESDTDLVSRLSRNGITIKLKRL